MLEPAPAITRDEMFSMLSGLRSTETSMYNKLARLLHTHPDADEFDLVPRTRPACICGGRQFALERSGTLAHLACVSCGRLIREDAQ